MPRPNFHKNKADVERPYLAIGERIREFRISKGLDQSDIMGQVQMSRVEKGLRAPTVELLTKLRELGADLNWVIVGE